MHQPLSHSVKNLLNAWITVEVLSPQTLREKDEIEDGRLIHSFEEPTPWLNPRFGRDDKEGSLYWMVHLGTLNLAEAQKTILQAFPDDEDGEGQTMQGQSALAILLLGEDGLISPDKGVLSSFAWGIGQLRDNKLDNLAAFPEVEQAFLDKLRLRLMPQDKDGKLEPISGDTLKEALNWLMRELNLTASMVDPEWQTVRIARKKTNADPPEPGILNSFFLDELATVGVAWEKKDVGAALTTYVTGQVRTNRQDLVQDTTVLRKLFEPHRYPAARWPGNGRHPLYLMQQAAVNHATEELKESGLVAVNGPPGTGKTTLLRDMIANIVTQRAIAMSAFDDPEHAFKHNPAKHDDGTSEHRYLVDPRLSGHEIVIASSNNKAVENISREIPALKAIAGDFSPPLRYFSSIADQLMALEAPKDQQETFIGSCWGLVAAVTGTAQKRRDFLEIFWWDNLRNYLWAIDGKHESRSALKGEKPPATHQEALAIWEDRRKDFKQRLEVVENLQKTFAQILHNMREAAKFDKEAAEIRPTLTALSQRLEALHGDLKSSGEEIAALKAQLGELTDDRKAKLALKPGWLVRFFQRALFREWQEGLAVTQIQIDQIRANGQKLQKSLTALKAETTKTAEKQSHIAAQLAALENRIQQLKVMIEHDRKTTGAALPDERFWAQTDKELQISLPWNCKTFNEARDDLFAAAFHLHHAFIDAAAKPLRHNLKALVTGINQGFTGISGDMRQALWASLFFVVPAISTTFASFGRQFASLGREQIGWLLIDEAGQATPQAAIGALWRSQRAMIIGDPQQIEPVTPLPKRLTATIFSHAGLAHEAWAAPWISAQGLADRASWLGTTLEQDGKPLWVGSPLRVHRRCDEPMFSISNAIAYGGLMVHATPDQNSDIGAVCGASGWIDVQSSNSGKWSPAEGKVVLDILERLIQSQPAPDIYIITPFRKVASGLRQIVKDRFPSEIANFLRARIGTVHTFQGKEAEAVIFVLGASGADSMGARHWAGSRVNLLNVAVTRAKRRLYVVGDRDAWSHVPSFSELASKLSIL